MRDYIDLLAERVQEDPNIRQVVLDAKQFDGLKEDPGWQRLYERLRGQRDSFLVNVSRRMMTGQEVSRDEIVYHRGFYDGAMYAVAHPEVAFANLERAAKMAYFMKLNEFMGEEEEDTPYTRASDTFPEANQGA